ncbi:hypothetical protein J6590_063718 [Homalodisca vitripennis]|nr:hypothetical protein J6590_063718 [Homalodisca vitripennis]
MDPRDSPVVKGMTSSTHKVIVSFRCHSMVGYTSCFLERIQSIVLKTPRAVRQLTSEAVVSKFQDQLPFGFWKTEKKFRVLLVHQVDPTLWSRHADGVVES